jgi:hypothetical protein
VVDKKAAANKSLPESLRVGPPGYTPNASQEMLRPTPASTNPYLQRQNSGGQSESSADAWGGFAARPAPPSSAPPPPPIPNGMNERPVSDAHADKPDTSSSIHKLSNLSLNEPSGNPWQPALDQASQSSKASSLRRQDSGNAAWAAPAPAPARLAPPIPPIETSNPDLIDVEAPESPAWDEDDEDEDEAPPVVQEMPAEDAPEIQQMNEDRHAWDESAGQSLHPVAATEPMDHADPIPAGEGWNLVDHELSGVQESGVVAGNGTILETFPSEDHAPALPPRRSQEQPPIQPPRPVINTEPNRINTLSPGAAARTQKKETYEIKKIRWHDVNAAENPRVSPILVQNANGPCPLLALVNALTLSTPAHMETVLVETLRLREQVTLGLLLDAVFDELMSGRRGDAAQELPDVSDLYSFLITLHTGMNVNPRFFPLPATKSPSDPRNSMSHVHPSEREEGLPGTFEDTREMKLYSTFSIPLIHGWLPERNSPTYAALWRSAKSYEDAQNLMFHEEGLEDKLVREGLSFEEQATLEDITTIKAFFSSHATQLTPYGLDTITASLAPGAVAILFRNDHFSTLYRHPDTLQLLQLVTDMGYAGHDEVVWESLLDVTGENAEFFSGDFRLVGGAPHSPVTSTTTQPLQIPNPNDGWTTAAGRGSSNQRSHTQDAPPMPHSPNIEQEDHDLALALQLQEEEEERHREEQARRRRETELSQQYIEQQGATEQRGNIPVSQRENSIPISQRENSIPISQRGSSIPVSQRGGARGRGSTSGSGSTRGRGPAQELRPAIPPRRTGPGVGGTPIDPEAGVDAPPPSYEQAANQAAYVPPTNHPSHPSANPSGRRMSAYSANSAAFQGQVLSGPQPGRVSRRGTGPTFDQIPVANRRNTVQQGQVEQQREKDCVVM